MVHINRSSFFSHVSIVVCNRSKKEVLGIHTNPIVAMVTNAQCSWFLFSGEFVRDTVGRRELTSPGEFAVSASVAAASSCLAAPYRSLPYPTSIFSLAFIYQTPKKSFSLWQWNPCVLGESFSRLKLCGHKRELIPVIGRGPTQNSASRSQTAGARALSRCRPRSAAPGFRAC